MSPGLRYLSTTVALLAVGLGYALIQGRGERPTPRPAAQSEAVARPVPPPTAPPPAREILNRRAALSLTADQAARLEALDAAAQELSRFMKEAQSAGGTSVQEIQRRSVEFRELSAALRERRRLHSEAAAHVLTESQRRQLAAATSTGTPGGGR